MVYCVVPVQYILSLLSRDLGVFQIYYAFAVFSPQLVMFFPKKIIFITLKYIITQFSYIMGYTSIVLYTVLP